MAYFSKENKTTVKQALEKVIPKTWKWSLSVQDSTQVTLTISSGDVKITKNGQETTDFQLNHFWVSHWSEGESETLMKEIVKVLTGDWYTKIQFGKYDKPFMSTGDKHHYHTPRQVEQ